MVKIILTRHGHVEGISPARFRGRMETPLTELGRLQAKAVAARIAARWKPIAVYTSPMGRCVATGQAIANACHTTCEVLSELNDLDYGQWQWKTYSEVRAAEPDRFATWFATPHLMRFPRGESLQELVARTMEALQVVLRRHRADADTVVMVGHDSVNRALLLQLLDQPLSAYWRLEQMPCGINEFDIADGRICVVRVNETGHLDGLT
jgi:probable phosphoglycerate mutase